MSTAAASTPLSPTASPTTPINTRANGRGSVVTSNRLLRASALAAMGAGILFAAVQIGHPSVDLALVTTPEWTIRQSVKIVMAVLALAGITGIYLRQVLEIGVLGLLGYLVFAMGYLVMLATEAIGLVVLPSIAPTAPHYVGDVLAAATNGPVHGDIGLMSILAALGAIGFLGGGLLFGIAVARAGVLARWPAILLAAGCVATGAIPLLPQVNQRLFALPPAVALAGLGWSLFRLTAAREDALTRSR